MAKINLLIDVGNTRLKWAMMDGSECIAGGKWEHGGTLSVDALNTIQANVRPERIAVAFVADRELAKSLRSWAQDAYALEVEFLVSPACACGVQNAYARPSTLGVDRWAALVAAHAMTPGYLCVVDAGSAVKIDLLSPEGQHLGGYILPGLSRIPACVIASTSLEKPAPVSAHTSRAAGTNTANCLAHGALHAICSSIEQTIFQLEQKVAQKVQCILTGGDSKVLAEVLLVAQIIEPALVLKGMAIMLKNGDGSP